MRCVGLAIMILLTFVSCGSDGDTDERRDVPTEWYLRSISEDDRTINFVYTISGVASGCEAEGTPLVDEADGVVTVTANKSVTSDPNRACTEELGYIEASMTLGQPLADRALVGCRPGKTDPTEDEICRDLERSRRHGIFEFSPAPSG